MTDDTAEVEQARPGRHGTRRDWLPPALRGRGVVVAVITAAALSLGGYSLAAFQLRANEQAERVDEAVTAVDQLCAQVRELGGYCIVDPADLRGEPGPEGPPGPPPSDAQVMEAVAAFLAEHPIQPGRPPTMAEISAAVADYLSRNPPAPGEPGPPPSQERVAGAVAAYLLANPPPTGPQGPAGEPGEDGQDSTVPGPPGPQGIPGADGADGEPPLSWTYRHCGVVTCVDYVCERTDPFDPAAPRYECRSV